MTERFIKTSVSAIVLAVAAGLIIFNYRQNKPVDIKPVACTQEAKICPDGSAVGRTGPDCEFAECPATIPTNTIAIGTNATIGGTLIGVLELVEDSRCPVDVQCIWAGTVRVRVSINSYNRDFVFTLGQPQVVGSTTITLASVIPAEKNSKKTVPLGDYRFIFTVVPKIPADSGGGILPVNSGVRGTVELGPTCPVERIPPDPNCADRPYATTVTVYRIGSNSAFAEGRSDTDGVFQFSLPPGSYTLKAAGGTVLPRCSPADVTVGQGGFATTTISCDSGIR
jgi:hypothetical protein